MNTNLVLTLLGPDRPGLVESLADIIQRHGGNWIESRMAHLAGQFAGVMRVSVPEAAASALEEELVALDRQGVRIVFAAEPGDAREGEGKGPWGAPATLDVVGQDRPGIVAAVSRVLARRGVNLEELGTECSSAPWSGETMFRAHARLAIPEDVEIASLRRDLESIAPDLMVDLSLIGADESGGAAPQVAGGAA